MLSWHMSTESSGGDGQSQDTESDHSSSRFLEKYLGPISRVSTPQNKFKIRRGFETTLLVVITLGFIWWLYELAVYLSP